MWWRIAAIGLLLAPALADAQILRGPIACGELRASYGPFDYRVAPPDAKELVEGAHFTPEVRTLMRGRTSGLPGGDIAYTLRVFPNHPQALLAMMNLSYKEKTNKPFGSTWSVECWFDRGERFRPDDPAVKMLFGIYLLKQGRQKEAVEKLEAAEKLSHEDPNLYYNLGLAFVDLKQYDKALSYAHKAYGLNFPLPGLRDKLKRVGAWKEMPPRPAQDAPVAATSAPSPTTDASSPSADASAPPAAASAPEPAAAAPVVEQSGP